MYSRFRKAVGDVNVVVTTYQDKIMRDVQMKSGTGTVAFGSGLRGLGVQFRAIRNNLRQESGHGHGQDDAAIAGKIPSSTPRTILGPMPSSQRVSPIGFLVPWALPVHHGTSGQLMHATMNDDTEAVNEDTETYTKTMATFGNCRQG